MKTTKATLPPEALSGLTDTLYGRLAEYDDTHDYDADLSPKAKEYLASQGISQVNPYLLYDALGLTSTAIIRKEKTEYYNNVDLMLPDILRKEDYSLVSNSGITVEGTCDLRDMLDIPGLSPSALEEIQELIEDAVRDWAVLDAAEEQMLNMQRLFNRLQEIDYDVDYD